MPEAIWPDISFAWVYPKVRLPGPVYEHVKAIAKACNCDVDVYITCATLHGLADQFGGNTHFELAEQLEGLANSLALSQPNAKVTDATKSEVHVHGKEVNGGGG